MYQTIGNTAVITKSDWLNAGLTENQFKKDSRHGFLKIWRRSTRGNTLIDLHSIQRPDRLEMLIKHLGSKVDALDSKMDAMAEAIKQLTDAVRILSERAFSTNTAQPEPAEEKKPSIFQTPEIDLEARTWFLSKRPNGQTIDHKIIPKYVNRCSILNTVYDALQRHKEARAKHGSKPVMSEFYKQAQEFYLEQSVIFPCEPITNVRSFERLFKGYFNGGKKNYNFILNGNSGNDNTRKVSAKAERLILALWMANNKPFKEEVHRKYMEFVTGEKEFFDKETGEIFKPEDFMYKTKKSGILKPLEISVTTIWNYLKKHINDAATVAKRDGGYTATVEKMPFDFRKPPEYSLSKISMDDNNITPETIQPKIKISFPINRLITYPPIK